MCPNIYLIIILNVGTPQFLSLYQSLGKFSRWQIEIFLIFPRKQALTFSCKLSPVETICMKCQNLFSGENKKNISWCRLLKFLSRSAKHYHTCLKFWASPFYYLLKCLRTAGWVTNSVDPDQMLQHLIRVYTVCSGLSVPLVWLNMHLIRVYSVCSVDGLFVPKLGQVWQVNFPFAMQNNTP